MKSNCPSYFGWLSILLTVLFVALKILNLVSFTWGIVFIPCLAYWAMCILGLLTARILNHAVELLYDQEEEK